MSEISKLKRRARVLCLSLRSYDADCGNALLELIDSRYAAERVEFEQVMARLREIDPECPR